MDRNTESTDAYVEIKLAQFEIRRTTVAKQSLSPLWNQDFRFEVTDDTDLQDEPLELRILDYDALSNANVIGTLLIDLNPLLTWDANDTIAGWFPIYDTLRGIRGEIQLQIKLQFFGDSNPFKESSAGVQFFCGTSIPPIYEIKTVLGFVDMIDYDDDPEYHWADSLRSPRVSNEARERLFYQLSNTVRRQLGKKVESMGGNAVIGFRQYIDLENDQKTVTVRAHGTAVLLDVGNQALMDANPGPWLKKTESIASSSDSETDSSDDDAKESSKKRSRTSRATSSDDSDTDSSTSNPRRKLFKHLNNDPQLITLMEFPEDVLVSLGGLVTARSVKRIEEGPEVREAWWQEVREEIKNHAKTLGCDYVVGYTETLTVEDQVYVLTACGTAAMMDTDALELDDDESSDKSSRKEKPSCSMLHIPYNRRQCPFPMSFEKCHLCRIKHVPEMILATVECPKEVKTLGEPVLIQAQVCRWKKRKEEAQPTWVSDTLPFMQYDIHRQLIFKLRMHGFNAVFGLGFRLEVGENLMVATVVGKGVFLAALPLPPALKISRNLDVVDEEDEQLLEIQDEIVKLSQGNRARLEKLQMEIQPEVDEEDSDSDSEKNHVPASVMVQIDDDTDEDLLAMLLERPRNDHFYLSLDKTKSSRVETITMMRHCHLGSQANRQLADIMRDMWEELEFRLSFLGPVELLDVDQGLQVLDEGDLLFRNVVTIGRPDQGSHGVEVTSLSEIPGRTMDRYLGKLSLHFVKEEHLEMDSSLGGMAGFVYTFLNEVHVMARAHAVALGGNVITSFRMEQTVFSQDVRSTGYGVISLSGDVGYIEGL